MPTENRSSNNEQMVSVPRDEVERLVKLLQYQAHPYPSPHAEFWQGLLDAPVAQHQDEPVAYWVIDEFGQKKVVLPGSETVARGKTRGYAMRPLYFHPPTSDGFSAGDMADQGAKTFREGVKSSADLIQKRMDDYLSEFGAMDPETGSVELPRGGDEYVGELQEIIEAVRALPMPQ
ncbi:hypothetical protein [Pseudomonas sp.]|uniref:hypothetical protein n=1 Tax=Pseudomonas sp. TaxID=306 RepID=UPI002FC72142